MGTLIKMLILTFLCLIQFSYSQLVYVNSSRGQLVGYHKDNGNNKSQLFYGQADVFLGVPYVQAPVGSLRFQRPQRLDKFPGTGAWNATYWRPHCPQHGNKNGNNEDCLYLNIFTPNASSIYKYPVMLWIHGGGLDIGDSNMGIDGPIRNLVSRGVILVTIQYRLNVLGFFTTFTDDFPPNNGMLDQAEAIKFIKDEIVNFGGDPYRITLFGDSGGAASVSAHTYSPVSQNLFQLAIQESGSIYTNLQGALGMSDLCFQVAQKFCNYTAEMWNSANYGALKTCLMNYDPIQLSSIDSGAQGWKIMQDNYFLPDVPRNLWQKRPNIPRIMGTSKDEWAYYEISYMNSGKTNFTDYSKKHFEAELEFFASIIFGDQLQTSINIFEHMFVPPGTADDDHFAWLKATVDVLSAAGFSAGISKDMEFYLRNNNSDVYVYEFTWPGIVANKCHVKACEIPGWNPVVHASETKYVFMEEGAWLSVNASLITPTDFAVADFFGEAWTNFAKYGRPTLDGTWSPTTEIDVTKTEYFEIGQNMGMRVGYCTNERVAWNAIVPAIVGDLPPEMPDYNNGSHVGDPSTVPTETTQLNKNQSSTSPSSAITQGSTSPSSAITQGSTSPSSAITQSSTSPSNAITQRITGLLGNVLLIFSIITALFGSTNIL